MNSEPCPICGGTDLNLIDGYYYCVECGTQDTKGQETVVEHTVLADGTFAHAATRKITKVLKDAIEMSGEWHKWHAFNFILIGLVDELISLGASPSFRIRALWIWARYMKMFVDKKQMGTVISKSNEKEDGVMHKSLFEYEDELDDSVQIQPNLDNDGVAEDSVNKNIEKERNKKKNERDKNSIRIITKGVLLSILYTALNLERSDIQLSHLLRFISEGRLSISNCIKFVPKELDIKSIPHWKNFVNGIQDHIAPTIRQIAMTLIKVLDLGKPLVPNLRKLINMYVTELCLPNDFTNLVFSLMHQAPCDFLNVNYYFAKRNLARIPDFEGVAMSYIVVALKMTFGLDDHYEVALSDTVDKINFEDNRLKSYKLCLSSESSDRMFSFSEWSKYLQFRKIILCKNYLPMAQVNNLDVDDKVFIEHLEKRRKIKVTLADEVTMDILNKIVTADEDSVIPKSEFFATLTPLVDYTNVVLQYIQDPDVKLLISEDFTQYSIKYACQELKLLNNEENMIRGVSADSKIINKIIVGNLTCTSHDYSMVYVRDCENKHWLKTNPPTVEHVTKIKDNICDKDSDTGYDSNLELASVLEIEIPKMDEVEQEQKELEIIEEEKEGVYIFDDEFDNIEEEEDNNNPEDVETECNRVQMNNDTFNNTGNNSELERSFNEEINLREVEYNPETFQRERVIRELVLKACKKYKIPIPIEYNRKVPKKRKTAYVVDETGVLVPKKKKILVKKKRGEVQEELNKILNAYYVNVEKDLLEQVSEHLNSVVKDPVDLEKDNEEYLRPNCETAIENHDEDLHNEQAVDNEDNEENNFNKTVDSSLMEVDTGAETTADDLIPKVNPAFDEKTHDIKQLFVKYSQNLYFESIFDNDDPDIDKILEDKIENFNLNDSKFTEDIKSIENDDCLDDNNDEEEEIEEDILMKAKEMQRSKKLEPLIENPIEEFKYWRRHYTSMFMKKNIDSREKFDKELKENFPKSFVFVMKECAAIINCSAFILYKHVQNLEEILFK